VYFKVAPRQTISAAVLPKARTLLVLPVPVHYSQRFGVVVKLPVRLLLPSTFPRPWVWRLIFYVDTSDTLREKYGTCGSLRCLGVLGCLSLALFILRTGAT